ncbi:hypothetical protein ACS127_16195 [Amphibacillus sp. Q70]
MKSAKKKFTAIFTELFEQPFIKISLTKFKTDMYDSEKNNIKG